MNLSIKTIVFVCIVAAAFTACKKKSGSPAACYLVSQVDSTSGDTHLYQWNKGKIVSEQFSNFATTYTYYNGLAVQEVDTSGVLAGRDSFYLNSAGYASRRLSNGVSTTYEYDGDGHRTKEIYINPGIGVNATDNYDWSGGNTIKWTHTDRNSLGTIFNEFYTTFEYYTDRHNWQASTTNIWGKSNANLLKKLTDFGTGENVVIEYLYEYDSKNNPTTIITIQKDSLGNVHKRNRLTNTFQCN